MLRQVAAGFKNATIVAVLALAACSTHEAKQTAFPSQAPSPGQVAPAASTPTTAPTRALGMREPSWQYAGARERGNYDSYIDENSITDRGGFRYAWSKIVHRTVEMLSDGTPYKSILAFQAYDCASSMLALVSLVYYGSDGSVVYSSPANSYLKWEHVIPDSMAAEYLRFVCNGERPEPPVPVVSTRKPEFYLDDEPLPDVSLSKQSAADIFKTVKSSVWILISFDMKNGKPDLDRGNQGSAVAIGPTTLLTNCHTLAGHSIHGIVQTETDRVMPVKIRKADYAGDRCVLEAPSRLPSHVQIKSYSVTDIGEEAYSIGAPAGLELTIANGIVSSKRNIKGVRYLQTTAPISPGSSGGGLFDRNGMLIGITTMFRDDGQNLNFAIAADSF